MLSRIFSIFLFLIFCSDAFAEESAVQTDYTGIVQEITDRVFSKKLKNGLQVIIYPRPTAPVFSAVISVRVGSVDEAFGKTGLAHMLEHMAFKGSKTMGTNDFAREAGLLAKLESLVEKQALLKDTASPEAQDLKLQINELNQELNKVWDETQSIDQYYSDLGGVGLNAVTGADYTSYFISLPVNAFENWCALEADRLGEPVWRQFYQERDVVLEERRLRYVDDPDGRLYQKILANSFDVHPYRNPTIGYEDDLLGLTASDVDAFYKKHYVAENIVISLAGDLDPEQTFETIEDYFSTLPSGRRPKRTAWPEPLEKGAKEFSFSYSSEPRLVMSFPKPNYPNREDLALNLWLETMISGNTAPIYKDLVINRTMATALSYFEGPGSAYPNLYLIYARPVAPVDNSALVLELRKSIDHYLKVGIPEDLLMQVKRRMKTSLIYDFQSNMEMAQGLAHAQHVYHDWKHYFSWLAEIDRIPTSEINAAARKYLNADNVIIGKLETEK